MANTTLPTNITSGTTGLISDANTVHGEVNELSRNTGLRSVSSLLINGWTATSVYIERVRDHTYLYVRGLDGTGASSGAFLSFSDLGAGFRPIGNSFQSDLHEDAAGDPIRLRADANNILSPLRDWGGYNRVIVWRSTASFPAESSWPGTAV